MNTITLENDLSNSLIYNPLTGVILWKEGTKRQGKEAGNATKRGHRTISRNSVLYQAHRIAWLLHYKQWPKHGIDHIDGNPGNNRISNLRDVEQETNNKNKRLRKDSKTGVLGVSWCKTTKKWSAYININKKMKKLGYYSDFNKAVSVRKHAERENNYHPNHSRA